MRQRAQSSLEYAVMITAVVAALIGMTIYLKRGIQGRLRGSVEEIGAQYDPGKTTGQMTVTSTGKTKTVVETKSVNNKLETTTTTNVESEKDERHGKETVSP